MVKTRAQLKSEAKGKGSTWTVVKKLYKEEGGVRGFYKG